jgi:hypothetical protein
MFLTPTSLHFVLAVYLGVPYESLRKKPVKCYIWSIGLYGAETWTLWKVDQKYLESFEM